jgi:hypothetical protein
VRGDGNRGPVRRRARVDRRAVRRGALRAVALYARRDFCYCNPSHDTRRPQPRGPGCLSRPASSPTTSTIER